MGVAVWLALQWCRCAVDGEGGSYRVRAVHIFMCSARSGCHAHGTQVLESISSRNHFVVGVTLHCGQSAVGDCIRIGVRFAVLVARMRHICRICRKVVEIWELDSGTRLGLDLARTRLGLEISGLDYSSHNTMSDCMLCQE